MPDKELTINDFLERLSATNTSNEVDDQNMQAILRRVDFPKAIVTSGMVYLDGTGCPIDIHTTAKALIIGTKFNKKES